MNNPRFADYLKSQGKSFTDARLNSMSSDQLKLEIEGVDIVISGKDSTDFVNIVLKNGLLISEKLATERTKYKLNGLTQELYSNERYLDLVERVKLKYSLPSGLGVDPALELAFVVGQTAMIIHQNNTSREAVINSVDLDLDKPVRLKVADREYKEITTRLPDPLNGFDEKINDIVQTPVKKKNRK